MSHCLIIPYLLAVLQDEHNRVEQFDPHYPPQGILIRNEICKGQPEVVIRFDEPSARLATVPLAPPIKATFSQRTSFNFDK